MYLFIFQFVKIQGMSFANSMVRDRDGAYFTREHRGFLEILVFATQVPSLKNENGGLECSFCRILKFKVELLKSLFNH